MSLVVYRRKWNEAVVTNAGELILAAAVHNNMLFMVVSSSSNSISNRLSLRRLSIGEGDPESRAFEHLDIVLDQKLTWPNLCQAKLICKPDRAPLLMLIDSPIESQSNVFYLDSEKMFGNSVAEGGIKQFLVSKPESAPACIYLHGLRADDFGESAKGGETVSDTDSPSSFSPMSHDLPCKFVEPSR